MTSDTILLLILAVGMLILNKELIFSEWFSTRDKQERSN